MYIITKKEDNCYIYKGEHLDYAEGGIPFLTDENVRFPPHIFNAFDVGDIPEDIIPIRYCYTAEQGFYPNPLWMEPEPTEPTYTLDEAAAIIASEVASDE